MSERDLIQRAQRGDQRALDELCQREWRPVFGIVYQAVRDRNEAQDLTQEVSLRALRSIDRYRQSGAPFRAYLRTIALNLVRDRWRRRQPHTVDIAESHQIASTDIGPEDLAMSQDDLNQIQRALDTLSEDHRQVIQLRVIDGRSAPEVAEIMERSPAAIRQLQYRAISALRSKLRKESRT